MQDLWLKLLDYIALRILYTIHQIGTHDTSAVGDTVVEVKRIDRRYRDTISTTDAWDRRVAIALVLGSYDRWCSDPLEPYI